VPRGEPNDQQESIMNYWVSYQKNGKMTPGDASSSAINFIIVEGHVSAKIACYTVLSRGPAQKESYGAMLLPSSAI